MADQDQITENMVACWRVNYGLDKMTPADAMRWWAESCNGSAPAGAVAALGLCLAERDSLLLDWVAEQGQRTAAETRAERAELERDRLRADVRELVECLAESVSDTEECLTHHLQAYGETYRPQRAVDYRAQIVKARALLAKHKETT